MKKVYLSTIFLVLFPTMSFAGDMYCNNQFVSVGESKHFVKEICGAPSKRHNWTINLTTKINDYQSIETPTHYSRWTYNRGSNTFIEYLTFKDGRLISIVDGNYGTN